MVGVFGQRARSAPHLLPLRPEEVSALRRPISTPFATRALREHVARHPALAWRTTDGEYVIGGCWRQRDDVGTVEELAARRAGPLLLERLIAAHAAAGARLVVLSNHEADVRERFYVAHGFREIDRIVRMEKLDAVVPELLADLGLRLRPYAPRDAEAVLAVERRSFDWLWWNSAEELRAYVAQPTVRVVVAESESRIVGYSGSTVHRRDGHLDRLAVDGALQGRGLGRLLLVDALSAMRAAGARWIGLTTQTTNERAQALYRRHGFLPTPFELAIVGRWLDNMGVPCAF